MVWVLGLVFTVWFQLACANNQNNAKYPSKDGDAEVQVLKSWYATNAMGVFIWMSPKNILPQSHTCIAILQTQNLACNIVLLQRWAETVAKGWSCGSHASEAWVEKETGMFTNISCDSFRIKCWECLSIFYTRVNAAFSRWAVALASSFAPKGSLTQKVWRTN